MERDKLKEAKLHELSVKIAMLKNLHVFGINEKIISSTEKEQLLEGYTKQMSDMLGGEKSGKKTKP